MSGSTPQNERTVLFISKATPGDDEFALWLAPRLEAAGYEVFADIVTLEPGTRWRKEITSTLQDRAIKMLLCCRDSSLASEGVQEEIGIASDLVKQLKDPKFVIPIRLEPYKKLFGMGELQYIDFVRGWGEGLAKLLETLKRQKVRGDPARIRINPNWEIFRRRGAIPIANEPERLTSNWLRVAEGPDFIRYFEPTGAVEHDAMEEACRVAQFPAYPRDRGFFAFGNADEINETFVSIGRFAQKYEFNLLDFIQKGATECNLEGKDASNIIHSMYRSAWNNFCCARGLLRYEYSKYSGFHITSDHVKLGEKISWGKQGDRRSSMLRNEAKGHIWQFGITGVPAFWPFHHFKLKSRVLFASTAESSQPYDDSKKQHRLRRTVCKGWRNKQWHGRTMAFLELLVGDSAFVSLPLSPTSNLLLDPTLMLFTSPVRTVLPNVLGDEDDELDESTLGRPEREEEPE